MKKFYIIMFLLVINYLPLTAQEVHSGNQDFVRCYTTEMTQELSKKNSVFKKSHDTFENWIHPLIEDRKKSRVQDDVIVIPVVIHIIHNGDLINTPGHIEGENISYQQAVSQIKVLNEDYRRLAGTPGAEITGYGLGVDTKIEFRLATIAPDGTATNGIDRVNMCQEFWTRDQVEAVVKPATIWDPTKYLNMWTVKFNSTKEEILGYAQFPVQSGLEGLEEVDIANTDGVVANYKAFGTIADDDGSFVLAPNYDYGRTMTHEIGHWLGLIHIWGDGGCEVDDFCQDTPNAARQTDGCPSNKNTCNSKDMIENYMDYTYDPCMNTFTNDQKIRMRTVLTNSPRRKELKDANVFIESNYKLDAKIKLSCASNEDKTLCELAQGIYLNSDLTNTSITPITSAQISYGVIGKPQHTYEWTGLLNPFETVTIELPVINQDYVIGTNRVSAEIIQINGIADDFKNNNLDNSTYVFQDTKIQNYTNNKLKLVIQPDDYGSDLSWEIRDAQNQVIQSGGPYQDHNKQLIEEIFEINPNSCYTFIIYDSKSNGICCGGYYSLSTQSGESVATGSVFQSQEATAFRIDNLGLNDLTHKALRIYPNPSTGMVYLDYDLANTSYDMLVYNELGQVVLHKVQSGHQIDLHHLPAGVYIIQIKIEGRVITDKLILK